jgi:hypothetical protein
MQDESFEPEAPLMEDYDEFLTAVVDPAFRVALICGTARHSTAASSSSRLYAVSQALATAVTLVDELHTAPLDPTQAAKMEAAAAAAAAAPAADVVATSAESSSSTTTTKGSGKRGRTKKTDSAESAEPAAAAAEAERDGPQPDPSKVPVCGINVDVYWGDDSGRFYQLPRTSLAATAPADLAAALPALATARFESATALAAHLKASGAGAALSLLPGGALAAGGQLAAACAAAGVPLAVQDSSSSSGGEQQQQPVLGRAAVLRELCQRGYLTLPVFEVQRDQVVAARGELEALFDAFTAAQQVPEEAAHPDDAFVDDEDDQEGSTSEAAAGDAQQQGTSSSSTQQQQQQRQKPVSPLLIAWSAARYVQDPPTPPAAAAAGEEAADESETSAAAAAVPALPAFAQEFMAWCVEHGFDPDSQLLSVSDASGGELLAAVGGGARLLQHLMDMCSEGERRLCMWHG